jgi:hypothetical protein
MSYEPNRTASLIHNLNDNPIGVFAERTGSKLIAHHSARFVNTR